ncbi:MAG: hypothetical protein ACOCRZ_06875 [Halothermotrichaceae bacterium]
MNNFLKKVEHFFITLIIVILIILVSVQFLMKNDAAQQKLQNIEFAVREILNPNEAVEVTAVDNKKEVEYDGFIVIKVLQQLSYPQIYVKLNGEIYDDFSNGFVEVKVREGDLLAIDARYFDKPLWFEITYSSPDISSLKKGHQIRVYNSEKIIDVIKCREQRV